MPLRAAGGGWRCFAADAGSIVGGFAHQMLSGAPMTLSADPFDKRDAALLRIMLRRKRPETGGFDRESLA